MSSENTPTTLRPILGLAVVSAGLAIFGMCLGERIGGLGPSLAWIGTITAALALAGTLGGVWLLRSLGTRRPDLLPGLRVVASNLGIATQVLVLALVVLELTSRVTHPLPKPPWSTPNRLNSLQRPDPTLGWVPAKNYTAIIDVEGETEVSMQTNSMGFRDIEQERDPELPCLTIIGDSFAVAWGSEYEEGITTRLRQDLPEIQVFNTSWAGWSKDQIALSYSVRAKPLEPDVVLAVFMVEPGVDHSGPLYFGQRKPWFTLEDGLLEVQGMPLVFNSPTSVNRAIFLRWEAEAIRGPLSALHYLGVVFPRRYLAAGARMFPALDWDEINRSGLPSLGPIEAAILSDLKKNVEADGGLLLVMLAPRPTIFRNCPDPAALMDRHMDSYREIDLNPLDITRAIAGDWQQCYNPEQHPNGRGLDRVREELGRNVRRAMRRLGKIE